MTVLTSRRPKMGRAIQKVLYGEPAHLRAWILGVTAAAITHALDAPIKVPRETATWHKAALRRFRSRQHQQKK